MACPHCGKVAKPIKDENGKINLKNLLMPDLSSIVMLVVVASFMLAFHYADQECSQVRSDPCKYCPTANAGYWQQQDDPMKGFEMNFSRITSGEIS